MLQNLPIGNGSKEKIIFKSGSREISWQQFLVDVDVLSTALSSSSATATYQHRHSHQHAPIPPALRWALCCKDAYLFTVSLYATLNSKGCPVLLPNNNSGTIKLLQNEFDAILMDSADVDVADNAGKTNDIDVATSSSKFSDVCAACKKISLPSGFSCSIYYRNATPNSSQPAKYNGNNEQIILFTSGSAGAPKKIVRSLKQTLDEIKTLEDTFGSIIADGAEVYSTVSHQHIYGILFYIFWPLFTSRTIHLPPLAYPENIEALLAKNLPAILISSPALLSRMSPADAPSSTHAKTSNQRITIFSSGGKLQATTLSARNLNIIDVLGSTETGGIAFRKFGDGSNDSWTPFPKVHVSLDAQTQCLKVFSPLCDCDNWIMGDKARINPDGTFQLLERADRIAKIEGKRISLSEIENVLKQHQVVKDAYVVAMEAAGAAEAKSKRQYVAALVVLTSAGKEIMVSLGRKPLNAELKKLLAQYFEPIILPKQFRYTDAIPCNAQGKVVTTEIRKLFEN